LQLFCVGSRKDTFRQEAFTQKSPTILNEKIIPESYKLSEQLSILRNHNRNRRASKCNDRYLLFILDSSASISKSRFENIVYELSQLVPLFCNNAKVAVITYGSEVYHEFCFGCHDNYQIKTAIASIPYRGGGTSTGMAIKCACSEILKTRCGLPSAVEYRSCPAPVDVIMITDGESNGHLNACEQAKCFHNPAMLYDINVFAIGVGDYNKNEINCLRNHKNRNANHVFVMKNFKDLEDFFEEVVTYLKSPINPSKPEDPNNYRFCYDLNN